MFLRSTFTMIAAATVWLACSHTPSRAGSAGVVPGIEVLAARSFAPLEGKRVGLITNHTGVTRTGESDIDFLYGRPGFQLVALFSPEHGIRGDQDIPVDSSKDPKTGLPVFSLYGKTMKPTREMLKNLDVLVFDIQDIGTRFYTYIGTMALAMQAARESDKTFVVLDRPNPIGGEKVQGAIPNPEICSGITCIYPIPTRHGMTVGELALLFNTTFGIGARLEVIPVEGWTRSQYFDETGLAWLNPSPNMKTLTGAIFYPGLGVAETTALSVGRGTARPFEVYGAPYFDSKKILRNLKARSIPGIEFEETSFVPTAPYHPYKDKLCHGVQAFITDRERLDPVLAGLHMVQAFYQSHPTLYSATEGFKTEVGDRDAWQLLTTKKMAPEQLIERWQPELEKFKIQRARVLLYP